MPTELGAEPDGVADQTDLDILNDEGGGDASGKPGAEDTETSPEGAGAEGEGPADGEETPPEPVRDPNELEEEDTEKTDEEKAEDARKAEEARSEPEIAKKLKAEYPDLFKKYPEVRKALFQSRQFTELFASVDEAKEASEKVQTFDEFERDITSGNSVLLFQSLINTGPDTFEKFTENLLPTIEKFAPALPGKMVFPYIHRIFSNALEDAKSTNNKDLLNSVGWLSRYLFGKPELPELKKSAPPEANPEVVRLRQENQHLAQARAIEFNDGVMADGLKQFRVSVEQTFKNDSRFSPIEKKALVNDIIQLTRAALDKDQRHNKLMRSHWGKASSEGHPRAYVPRVVNAFLGGAKSQMPAIRAKVVAAALREKGITEAPRGNTPGNPRTGPGGGSPAVSSKNIDYRKSSDMDILNGKAILRK